MKNDRYVDLDRVLFAIECVKERSARTASGDYKTIGRACDMVREMIQELPSCQPVSLLPSELMEDVKTYAAVDRENKVTNLNYSLQINDDSMKDVKGYLDRVKTLHKKRDDVSYSIVYRVMEMCGYSLVPYLDSYCWISPEEDKLPFE